jgi:Tfp pilus assembly protein PilF
MLHEAGRAIMILNDAVVAHWASDCWDYLEMADIYLAMGKKALARDTYRKAHIVAQQSQDAAGVEAALLGIAKTD